MRKRTDGRNRLVLFGLMMILLLIAGCGSEGEFEGNIDGTPSPPPTPDLTFTSADIPLPPFQASGVVDFEITHTGNCTYEFDLLFFQNQLPFAFLARGSGDFSGEVTVSLASMDYILDVNTACPWTVDIYGDVVAYAPPNRNPITGDCNCEGCCPGLGGVICVDGETFCADGSFLPESCVIQGCTAFGCPGCF